MPAQSLRISGCSSAQICVLMQLNVVLLTIRSLEQGVIVTYTTILTIPFWYLSAGLDAKMTILTSRLSMDGKTQMFPNWESFSAKKVNRTS